MTHLGGKRIKEKSKEPTLMLALWGPTAGNEKSLIIQEWGSAGPWEKVKKIHVRNMKRQAQLIKKDSNERRQKHAAS